MYQSCSMGSAKLHALRMMDSAHAERLATSSGSSRIDSTASVNPNICEFG